MIINKIGVLSSSPFPIGCASVVRIFAYCKGLVSNNVNCEIVVFKPHVKGSSIPIKGNIDGVKFQYAHQRDSSRSILYKNFIDRPISLLKSIQLITRLNRIQSFDYLLLSFDALKYLYFFVPILRWCGYKLIFIGDEYPPDIRDKGKDKITGISKILYKFIFKFIKARILINENLKTYFNEIAGCKTTHILPSIVDVERFTINSNQSFPKIKYLCYVGGMDLSNDNVDLIIEAFNDIHKQYPFLYLYLYGAPKDTDKQILQKIIDKYQLHDRVLFKGKVAFEDVPKVLMNAYVLVTSQSKSKRAEGGLPTKLGEYLMSGIPSLVSDVSVISQFLKDGEHLFIVTPDNKKLYVEKLQYILNNYPLALEVAMKGKCFFMKNFNCSKVAYDLKLFLESL